MPPATHSNPSQPATQDLAAKSNESSTLAAPETGAAIEAGPQAVLAMPACQRVDTRPPNPPPLRWSTTERRRAPVWNRIGARGRSVRSCAVGRGCGCTEGFPSALVNHNRGDRRGNPRLRQRPACKQQCKLGPPFSPPPPKSTTRSPLAHAARPSGTSVRGAMAVTLVPDPPPRHRSRANQKFGQPPCLTAAGGPGHDSQRPGRRQLAPTHPQRVPPLQPGAVATAASSPAGQYQMRRRIRWWGG